jgi:hypothetical protein
LTIKLTQHVVLVMRPGKAGTRAKTPRG